MLDDRTLGDGDLPLGDFSDDLFTGTAAGTISLTGAAIGSHGISATAAGIASLTGAGTEFVGISGSAAGIVTEVASATGDVGVSGSAAGEVALSGAATGDVGVSGSAVAEVALTGEAIGEAVFPEPEVVDAPAIIRGGRLGSGGPNLVRKPQLEAIVGYGVGQVSLFGEASGEHALPGVTSPPTVPTQRQPAVANEFIIYPADEYAAIGSGSGVLLMASSATGSIEDGWVAYDNDLVIAA